MTEGIISDTLRLSELAKEFGDVLQEVIQGLHDQRDMFGVGIAFATVEKWRALVENIDVLAGHVCDRARLLIMETGDRAGEVKPVLLQFVTDSDPDRQADSEFRKQEGSSRPEDGRTPRDGVRGQRRNADADRCNGRSE